MGDMYSWGGDFDAVGTRIWRGHTVGGGYCFSQNNAGIALRGSIDTRVTATPAVGGEVLMAGESAQATLGDIAAETANRNIQTGNGNITLMPFSEMLQTSGSLQMILETTGKISIAPVSGKGFWTGQTRTYNGTMSTTTFNGSSALAGVQIPNMANVGGLEIGTWSGTGVSGDSPYDNANAKSMTLDAAFTVNGPIEVWGMDIWFQNNITSTLSGGQIRLAATNNIISNTVNTKLVSTNGGDVILAADRDGDGWGYILNPGSWFSGTVSGAVTFDTRQLISGVKSTGSTGGGDVFLGGGNVSGTGYSAGGASDRADAVRFDGGLTIRSGGGDILIKGRTRAHADAPNGFGSSGFAAYGSLTVDAGAGKVYIEGISRVSGVSGAIKAGVLTTGAVDIRSAYAGADAITLIGQNTTTGGGWNHGVDLGGGSTTNATAGHQRIVASGTGGGITLDGYGNEWAVLLRHATDLITNGGPLKLLGSTANNGAGLFLRSANNQRWVSANVADYNAFSKASDLEIRFDKYDFDGNPAIGTAGTVVYQPYSTSFTNATLVNTNFFRWNQNSQTMTGFTFGKLNNAAQIRHETNALTVNGPVTFYGNAIWTYANITTTSASGHIKVITYGAGTGTDNGWSSIASTLTTAGGDIIIWSNAANRTSGTANNEIVLDANSTMSSNGGKIILAGGLDDGSNGGTANDGNPDGYAYRGGYTGGAVQVRAGCSLLSGGGDIIIRGRQNGSDYAIAFRSNLIVNSGTGTISIDGQNSGAHGIDLADGNYAITSASTAATAITISGTTTSAHAGIVSSFNAGSGHSLIQTTGASGGGIVLQGINSGTAVQGLWLGNNDAASSLQVISNTGNISLITSGNTALNNHNVYLGNRKDATAIRGITPVATSAAGAITIRTGGFSFANTHGMTISTTGTLTVEPYATSFLGSLSWPISNLTLGASVSGLTLGKSGNTAGITIGTAQSIAGPITLYGGTLTLNANMTSTASGDISLNSDAALAGLGSTRTITTSGAFKYMPNSNSFSSTVTFPITNLALTNVTGVQLGKSGNTSGITIGTAASVNGYFTVYGGTVTLAANLTTTTSGDISIYSDKSLSVTGTRTVTAAGMFKYMPNGTSFESAVSYPVGSLTVNSNGLQLGKPGNTAALTITGASSSNGPVTVYTGAFTTDASATLTATSSALEVNASGAVTLNAALAGSTTTVNGQADVKTIGSLTNLNLTAGNAQSITGTATLTNLTLNKSAGTATVSAGPQDVTGVLTLTAGTLAAGGNLRLKSSASGTARVAAHGPGTGTVTGNVVVERFIPGGRKKQWRMLGFPYSGPLAVSAIGGIGKSFTSGAQSLMVFNESTDNGAYGTGGARNAGYQTLASNASISAGKGVAAWLFGASDADGLTDNNLPSGGLTITSQGPLNEDGGNVTLSAAQGVTNAVKGWNLVSNPFASPIDWHAVVAASTNLAAAVYRWDPQLEGWTSYNTDLSFTGVGSRHIESGAAFFVKAATERNNTLSVVIPQTAKTGDNPTNAHFSAVPRRLDGVPQRAATTKPRLAGIRVKTSGMGNPMPMDAYLDVSREDASKGWDPRYDGLMMSRSSGANVYFIGDENTGYSMHFDAPLQTGEKRYYPVAVTTPQVGPTTLEIQSEGAWNPLNSVSLIDTREGKTVLMQGGRLSYGFKMDVLKDESRFLLAVNHVVVEKDGGMPGRQLRLLGNPVTGDRIEMLLTHPTARPKRWELSSMNGAKVAEGSFAVTDGNIQYALQASGMRASGVYVLKVEMDNGEVQTVQVMRK
jgi:hypothetical protein